MSETRAEPMAVPPFAAPTEITLVAVTLVCCAISATTTPTPVASAVGVSALIPAALVDIRIGRLPDRLVAAAAAIFAFVAATSHLGGDPVRVAWVVAGSLIVAGPLFAIHLITPTAMGFGDVKAALVLGAALGAAQPIVALVGLTAATAIGGLWGLLGGRRTVPFGPALVAGAAIALVIAGGNLPR